MKLPILATIAAGVLLAGCPVAHADSTDDAFLHQLQAQGIPIYNDAGAKQAVEVAKEACRLLSLGWSDVATLQTLAADNPKVAVSSITTTMQVGIVNYCEGALNNTNTWSPPYASRG